MSPTSKHFKLPLLDDKIRERNGKRPTKEEWDHMRCTRCELPLNPERAVYFRFHHGGLYVVTQEEAERLNAAGEEGADMGEHPLGPECAKIVPKKFWLKEEK